MEKVLVQFDVASKPILVKFDPKGNGGGGQQQLYLTNEVKEKMHLERLMSGIKDFIALFGKTTTFAEQLKIFSLKSQPLLRVCLA